MLRLPLRLLLAIASLFAMLQPATGAAGDLRYVIDKSASRVDAKVPFFGIASKTARFPDMSGTFNLSFANMEALDMVVDIDARALTTGIRKPRPCAASNSSMWRGTRQYVLSGAS